MSFTPVQADSRHSLSEAVCEQIQAAIAQGHLQPGERLPPERDLAEQMGVSRALLREALVRLQADGFISSRGRGGMTVSDLGHQEITSPLVRLMLQRPQAVLDVLELRMALEGTATELATRRATDEDRARISKAFDVMWRDWEQRVPEADRARHDADFHLAIAAATRNFAIQHVLGSLHALVQGAMANAHQLVQDSRTLQDDLIGQHAAIRDGILAREPLRARRAAEAHLEFVRRLYGTPDAPTAQAPTGL
ncbi:FadR/GntR family transcriptional regulator [Amphibiibacter pelophylacis]|uniref:FadR/GntR family transcriptional regulator n=1 Tax=Amphibiibacter pelophylacis TaxID=1799477 RepID=A0ACC6P111_9BURK